MFFRKIKELEGLVKASRTALDKAETKLRIEKSKVHYRDILIKDMQGNQKELERRIVDLENNVEFLVNNLSKQKRELIRDHQSKN